MREDLASAIKAGLRSHRFGQRLHVYAQVGSTNDEAATLAAQGAAEGTAVLAVEQTGARGRRQRAWLSPAGGLWLSVVLRPALPRALLEQFDRVYALLALHAEDVLAGWRERDLTRGRQVRLSGAQELEGVAEGVDRRGALLVRTGTGIRRIVAGEVSLRSVSVQPP